MILDIYKDGAEFSNDRKYRFALWRVWNAGLPGIMFIGLNPSTANESVDDPTIKKVKKIANHNGFGRLYMLNLFPIVSSDTVILKTQSPASITHDHNLAYLRYFSSLSKQIVFAWGNFKEAKGPVSQIVINRFAGSLCLKQNLDGSPKHPLYCKDDSELQLFHQSKISYVPAYHL